MRLFVGRLPYSMQTEDLRALFLGVEGVTEENLVDCTVLFDRETGRSKGFGFAEITDDAVAAKAIEELNGSQQGNMNITVNEARPREERPRTGGFGGGNAGRQF